MLATSALSMRFSEKILFENVTIKFKPGNRYGLIGANGVGKSTFMKILANQLESSTGEVTIDHGCSLGYLKQDHYQYENETILNTVCMGNEKLWALHVERDRLYSKADLTDEENEKVAEIEETYGEIGGYTMDADAGRLLEGLGIEEARLYDPMNTLAGGFKLRVLLAQVLFAKPDILLLDEPTNHLDMGNIDWLVNFLKRHEGTIIVISHDRYFLNSVCTHTADLDYQEIRLFSGNYDEFMTANAMALESARKDNKKKEKRISELKGFINRFSANASKAKQATSRQRELQKIETHILKPSSRVSPFIRFNPKRRLGQKVIEVKKIGKSYEEKLFENFSCEISRDERVGIIGRNGVGKTTLLKILLGHVAPDSGKIVRGDTLEFSYFPQDGSEILNYEDTALGWLGRFSGEEEMLESDLRSAMGKMLFKGHEVDKIVEVLSGGEKARLMVSRMMIEGGNILALDEPTNHLDLEAIESLNYALSLVEGTIIFVSHDREFVRSLATRILEIDDQEIIDFRGDLNQFYDWKEKNRKAEKRA